MRKTIVVPTDFSVQSLNVLKNVLSAHKGDCRYDIILLHGSHLTDSITDLMFVSKRRIAEQLSNPAFEAACGVIHNKFASQINSIRKEIFTGFTQNAFDNFIEANKVEDIYVSAQKNSRFTSKKSFDVLPFVYGSLARIHEVVCSMETVLPEKDKVAEVFFNSVATS